MDGQELSELILDFNYLQNLVVISSVEEFKKVVDLINIGVTKFISKPIEDDQLHSVLLSVVQNIQKKKLQESKNHEIAQYNAILKEREEEHKSIIEAKIKELEEFNYALDVSAIVVKTDSKGVIKYANDKFCNVSGFTEKELIDKNINIINSGNRSKSFFKKLWNTITDKKNYTNLFQNRHKDGSIYYIETTINPIIDTNGNITEFIAVSHDMTQLMNSLANTKKAQQAKEEFFINISHEMKTPLNSILGFSSLLKKRVKNDAKSSMMIETIQETGNDLNNLVESILDIRKIKENKLILLELAFNPQLELSKCLQRYVKKSTVKNQEYKIFIDKKLPISLLGDPQRIVQVINIVLDNAIKFTPNGGKVDVNVFYDEFSKKLVCEVKDNGIGIEKKNQDKIFNTQQVDGSTNRSHEGAGLGLNIASSLIKLMKGEISLKSIPEKGSLFKIEFPLSEN